MKSYIRGVIAPLIGILSPIPVFAGNVESTIRNIQQKLTGEVALLVGAIFVAIAGYRMYSGKANASTIGFCLAAVVVIIKSQDIIHWITTAI